MGSMKLTVATVEMADGTVHENIRITLADRLRTERTARRNGWDMADPNHSTTVNTFGVYAALDRLGLIPGVSWDAFIAGGCTDLAINAAEGVLGDPTQPEAITG